MNGEKKENTIFQKYRLNLFSILRNGPGEILIFKERKKMQLKYMKFV